QKDYPVVASINSFEWIAHGHDNELLSPDVDIVLASEDSSSPVVSTTKIHKETRLLLQHARKSFDVNEMSLEALSEFLEQYIKEFDSNSDVELMVSQLQAQPCFLRPIYSVASPLNYKVVECKVPSHALFRTIAALERADLDELSPFSTQVQVVFQGKKHDDPMTLLSELIPDSETLAQHFRLAEVDLGLQILAPGIYFDPYKVTTLTRCEASRLKKTRWFLWDHSTILRLVKSPLGESLLKCRLPSQFASALTDLRAHL
ncbi:hypothetical protein PINS_up017498, partial [Pythium insidiosum]